ncbi:dCTP deaminase [Bremerella sp.]|uniref:dCTP deaminase n=1 Tax=Bremerella sp. TaxID=2795602 RepID=UPI00391DFCBB
MILKADRIAELLANPTKESDPLVITPTPNLEQLRDSGSGSIDLRLGTWFVTLRHNRSALLDVNDQKGDEANANKLTHRYYVPFGHEFILHPRCFVLGVTMEWIRLPRKLAGYVVGKSSWGRRGLVIATAVGVHPGFSGCLTLEITNLGEIPIKIMPGMSICQLFIHSVDTHSEAVDKTPLIGKRQPVLGDVSPDDVARKLADGEAY